MFIFKSTKLRANIFAPYTDENGTRYTTVPRELLEEIPDPVPPEDFSDDTYYRTEQDDAPYVVYTRKSDEQIKQIADSKIKMQISALEATQARCLREATLTGDKTRLQALDDQIAALRAQL